MFLFRSVFHPELIFSSTCLCLTARPFTCLFADFLCLPACRTVSVCLPVRLTVSVSPHTRLSAYMSHCLCLPACLPVCLPTARQPVIMPTYVFSNCLSLCTCVRLSVLLSSSKRDYLSTPCLPTRHAVCMTRCLSFRQNVQITVCHSVYLPVWFKFRSRE